MRWLLSNLKNKAAFAARNPAYAVKSLVREVAHSDERFLSLITGCPATEIRRFLNEPLDTPEFADALRSAQPELASAHVYAADLYAKKILVQYIALRAFKPDVVVETGIASGVSSSYLLLALHKNARGRLYSVDIGDTSYLPPGRPNGWVVPDWLRSRWEMRLGDSRHLLPELLAELGSTDVFIHDSLHTYEHMLWEFRAAYPYIRPGGLLFCDDALWNAAWPEFVAETRARRHDVLRGVGFLQKPAGNGAAA